MELETSLAPIGEQEELVFISVVKRAVELVSMVSAPKEKVVFTASRDESESSGSSDNESPLEGEDTFLTITQNVEGLHVDDSDINVLSDDYEGSTEAVLTSDTAEPLEESDTDMAFDSVTDSMVELVEAMLSLRDVFSKSSRVVQESLASQVFSLPGAIEAFYALSFNLFEFTQGLSSEDLLVNLYLLVLSNVESWVDVDYSLCEKLVQGGMLLQNINDLQYLEKMPVDKSEMLLSAVETNLSIISNCARNCPLPNFYCKCVPWTKIFSVWADSSNDGLRITCKLLANTVSAFVPDKDLYLLDMSDGDLSCLLTALGSAAQSADSAAEAFGYRYSTLEILKALKCVSSQVTNFHKIAKAPALLIPLTSIILTGKLQEKIASLEMLWRLLENSELKDIFSVSHNATLEWIRRELPVGRNEDIVLWGEGILASMQESVATTQEQDPPSLATLRCYYAAGKYTECESLCDKMSQSPEASLLKGKALYQKYQKMQRHLRMFQDDLEPREFFIYHKTCYDTARQAVGVFIRAKNDGYIESDDSCNAMLDFSIMDYLFETNKLKEIGLCFLCLKRPRALSSQTEPVGKETVKVAPKRAIRASHLIPHSVIKRLKKTVPESGGKDVVFGTSGTKMRNAMKRTPGTTTVYMLCPLCEHNLSVLGEEPFLDFLEKVYGSLSIDTDIEHAYGKELYHFCVGLIFRTLCPSQDDYINSNEVYQLLLQCRAFLTDDKHTLQTKIPEVFMFICPIEESYGAAYQAFITENSVSYTAKISLDCHVEELGTFMSVFANFFIVKLGIVIILVRFNPAMKQLIDERFHINPDGGLYFIPVNKARRKLIPAGVWTALHILFETYKTDLEKFDTLK